MNNIIPIFDSLSHPTINTHWGASKAPLCSIEKLLDEMKQHNIRWALTVGMKNIGDYSHESYINFIHQQQHNNKLFPIAFFDLQESNSKAIINFLKFIKTLGFVGIKLHPRISKFTLVDEFLPIAIDSANELGLTVLFCSYFYDTHSSCYLNNMDNLIRLFSKINSSSKVVLLHGGSIRLLETMEIARAFKNIILDVSFTICKYKGSSLDLDLQFLFNNFDERICIGSDFPEFSLGDLRERFEFFSASIPKEKAENIAYKNLFKVLNYDEIF